MVFVNVPTEIRSTADIQQAVDAHEVLSTSGDVARAAEVRLLLTTAAVRNPALVPEITAATARIDRNNRARESIPVETARLEVARGQIATKLNTPAERNAGMDLAVAQIGEARTKLAELGDNARADSITSSRMTLTTLYRDQIKAIQDVATTNKLRTAGATEVTIAPALTDPEKLRLDTSFGSETGQTAPSKLALGRGYIAGEGAAVEGVPANNEFRLDPAPIDTTFKLVAGKWQVERIAVGANPANAAIAYADAVIAHKYDLSVAPFAGDAAATAAGTKHNRMIDNLIALNAGTPALAVAPGPLGDMITRANTKEATDATAALAQLTTDQNAFFAGDFNAGVGRLNAALTPEAKTAALDSAVAPLGLRVMVKNRRDTLWTQLKTISDSPVRPSNYQQQVTRIMDHLAGPVPNGVGARLHAEVVRVGVVPASAPVTPDATIEPARRATSLSSTVDGRNVTINVVPATAQVSVRKPDGTVERKAAVGGIIRIENAAPGRYQLVSGALRSEVTVAGTPDAPLERPASSLTVVQNGRNVRLNVVPATAQVSVRKPDGTVEVKIAVAGVINMENLTSGRYEFTSGAQRAEVTISTADALALPATPDTTPEGMKRVEAFMKTIDGNVKTLTEALRTNAANLTAVPVRAALDAITKQLTPALLPADRQEIANRINLTVGVVPTTAADGRKVTYNPATSQFELASVLRLPGVPPPAEQKEINSNMNGLMKLLTELLRLFTQQLQVNQQSMEKMMKMQGEQFQKLFAQREQALRIMQQSSGNKPALDKARADYDQLDKRYQSVLAERDRAIAEVGKRRATIIRVAGDANLQVDEVPNYITVPTGQRVYAPRICVRPPVRYAEMAPAEQGRITYAMGSVSAAANSMGCEVTSTASVAVRPSITTVSSAPPSIASAALRVENVRPGPNVVAVAPTTLVQPPAAINISVGNVNANQITNTNTTVSGNNNNVGVAVTARQNVESANKVNVIRPVVSTGPTVAPTVVVNRPTIVPPTNPGSIRG